MAEPKGLYNTLWPAAAHPVAIEITCIQRGGRWKKKDGSFAGAGLFEHYKRLQQLLWPKKKWHRWNDMLLESYCRERIIGVVGPANSGKTHEAACYALCTYFAFPEETTVMVSSTEMRSLQLRVWGEIKKYYTLAKRVWPDLPGELADSRCMLTTSGNEDEGSDFRNGIVGIPCVVNGKFVGLSKYVGVKNKRLLLIADEGQFMADSFFDAIANLNKNPIFKCIAMGNPKDWNDALGKICEPAQEEGGKDELVQGQKTGSWRTRIGGVCIQLVGTDSPNYDAPPDEPTPFPFLITRRQIESDLAYYGSDSLQYSMMNLGMFPKEAAGRRVLTQSLCTKFGAGLPVVWRGSARVRVAGLDAAYGSVGGDRCSLVLVEFGQDVGHNTVLSVHQPVLVPVNPKAGLAEDQIASFCMSRCREWEVAPENFGFDSTGRGSLMASLARIWSPYVIPIEFGGKPTDRVVSNEIKKLCRDYYSKFVTELWFSVRLIVEAGQMRNLCQPLIDEGCIREWTMVAGNKIEVEPKGMTKQRMGRSPDLFDSLVTAVEMARRRGFRIHRLASAEAVRRGMNWQAKMQAAQTALRQSKQLTYS